MLLSAIGFACASAPDQDPPSAPAPLKVGPGITPPKLIYKIEPEYAESARKAGVNGTVSLQIVVEPDGRAHDIRILVPSLDPGLDRQGINAVAQWRFAPGMKEDKPVAVLANVEVNFRLLNKQTLLPDGRINYKSAEKSYRRAANRGNADAQYSLGVICYEDKRYVDARKWFEMAAAQALSQAEYRLGVLYQKGQGVAPSLVEAERWFQKAASHTEYRAGIMALTSGVTKP